MISHYIAALTRGVSRPRLEKYRPQDGDDLDMAVNYLWNMTLAEALCPSLAALEISLRNSIHDVLTDTYQTDLWFHHSHFVGNYLLRKELDRALHRLGAPSVQPTAGRIVAELHFFYWTTLISGYYHHILWNPNSAALLRAVFPYLSGPAFRRDRIHRRYNTIRIFRNRVFHHEPLLYGFTLPGQPTIGLDVMHDNIVEAIGWVSPELQSTVGLFDRFPTVWTTGEATIRAGLKQYLEIP